MNYIWAGLLAVGFIAGILNGRIEEVTNAAFSSAGRAVELSIGLLGIICLWSGLMKIMEESGMTGIIARLARPFFRLLFPQLAGNENAMGAIVMNLAANFMGLGNAATPLGIKAMEELQKVNARKDTATDAMCMFLVLNTSAIQLIPATVIAIRSSAGSVAPAEITSCIWAASFCSAAAGISAVVMLKRCCGADKKDISVVKARSRPSSADPVPRSSRMPVRPDGRQHFGCTGKRKTG